jgi:hypothetical protein
MLERFKVPEQDRVYVPVEQARRATEQIFESVGLAEEDAALAADVRLNDLRGVESRVSTCAPTWPATAPAHWPTPSFVARNRHDRGDRWWQGIVSRCASDGRGVAKRSAGWGRWCVLAWDTWAAPAITRCGRCRTT